MKIHLDTRDLINIVEKSKPCSASDLKNKLINKGHKLAISLFNAFEISAPLLQMEAKTNVMRSLNCIESMPICFIAEAKIERLELSEALDAFTQGREYRQISPFVSRFDETITIDGPPATQLCLNLSMAEAVFMLWAEDPSLFNRSLNYEEPFKRLFASERSLPKAPKLRANFIKMIERSSRRLSLEIPSQDLKPLAEWIYDVPTRCPTLRLGYEVFHNIVKNIGDIPKQGDILDLAHVDCIPYVDLITLDRRMCAYVKQTCYSIGLDFGNKIYNNVEEPLALL